MDWESRFRWLWANCTDGFHSPEGWWMVEAAPTEEDLAAIDAYIAAEKGAAG